MSAVSATALPGSHSSVPCAPMWTSASALATCCSQSPKATSAWRGGKAGIVIVGAPLRGAAAVGRQRDHEVAEFLRAETECAVAKIRIARRLAPGFAQPRDRCGGRSRQQALVLRQRERRVVRACRASAASNSRGVAGAPLTRVAGGGEIIEQVRARSPARRGRPHSRCGPARRDSPASARRRWRSPRGNASQADERGDAVGDHRDRDPLRGGSPAP